MQSPPNTLQAAPVGHNSEGSINEGNKDFCDCSVLLDVADVDVDDTTSVGVEGGILDTELSWRSPI